MLFDPFISLNRLPLGFLLLQKKSNRQLRRILSRRNFFLFVRSLRSAFLYGLSALHLPDSYDLTTTADDMVREFDTDIEAEDLDEIVEIVSEGMLVQWMKPYTYKQENLESVLNTRDFTTYSPSELLLRISATYAAVRKDFTNMMREYSYNHGDLSSLHL